MPSAHDAACLNEIAANSAIASRALVCEKLCRNDVDISCVHPPFSSFYLAGLLSCCSRMAYLRYARYSGPAEGEGARVAQKTMLVFTWKFVAQGLSQSFDVRLLCHNAARRGVHLPKAWENQLNFGFGLPVVDALADSAIRRVREELDLSNAVKLDCRP